MPDKLYEKYIITKVDGSSVDPNAQYFVLRLDSDVWARIAALRYATCCEASQPGLARDLRRLVAKWVGQAFEDDEPGLAEWHRLYRELYGVEPPTRFFLPSLDMLRTWRESELKKLIRDERSYDVLMGEPED